MLVPPGVYIEEVPGGPRTIVGVSTSTTAFVGRTRKGPAQTPTLIRSFGEFQRVFGGLWAEAPMPFAVQQYFDNGGTEAVIVRVYAGAKGEAVFTMGGLTLVASSPGAWAEALRVSVDHDTQHDPAENPDSVINLAVRDVSSPAPLETLSNLRLDPAHERFIATVLERDSAFLRTAKVPATLPGHFTDIGPDAGTASDGAVLADADLVGAEGDRTGIYALLDADIFNLLVLPPRAPDTDIPPDTWTKAAELCAKRRAMLIVDAPDEPVAMVKTTAPALVAGDDQKNAAVFYPRICVANPLEAGRLDTFAPGGAVAGVFARADAQRGVWKAPAGAATRLTGVQALSRTLSDGEHGELNPLGINCLRTFASLGAVVWGSRTMRGGDRLESEWKYVPVRRTALFIEESLCRGLGWVVFEPNAPPLWGQIRWSVGAFLETLFRQGAFQGAAARDAYFVQCDASTTTQDDIDRGVVNLMVGFAPLKPAEFVILSIRQLAGQTPP